MTEKPPHLTVVRTDFFTTMTHVFSHIGTQLNAEGFIADFSRERVSDPAEILYRLSSIGCQRIKLPVATRGAWQRRQSRPFLFSSGLNDCQEAHSDQLVWYGYLSGFQVAHGCQPGLGVLSPGTSQEDHAHPIFRKSPPGS